MSWSLDYAKDICIFCLYHKSRCNTCIYAFPHEYPDGIPSAKKQEKKQLPKKVDKQICNKCGVHAKNPGSATNGCSHEYPQ